MNLLRAIKLILAFPMLAGGAAALATDLPTPAEYETNWPRFRGPGGAGVYAPDDVPLTCDFKTGANIAWTAAVPAAGFSSPVVWDDRAFLSGGDEETREVMCFDVSSGKLLWQRIVPKTAGGADEKAEVPDQCGMAAATVATDGRRVYAMFANGDLAAFTFDGDVAWSKHLAVPKNPYGHATSLLTWQDRVIVQFDQGQPDDQLSKLYAFDGATGAIVWQQPRPAGASWATPITFDAAGQSQLVTLAVPWVISYAAKDGTELWRADCLDGEVTPSPIFVRGTLFIVSPSNKLQSIRPDGSGDVTKTHLGWAAEDNIPDVTSPVSDGELIFVIDTSGTLTCYDAKDGTKQWQQDLGEECNASPSIAGHRLYLITKKGTLVVAAVAREFKELARSPLGEPVLASPAFAQHKIFVRGTRHLICIGDRLTPSAPAR
ncbi:MAG: PQQ-binding-like beta-propeller repeat protein [Chthoniobacteraceae bacterium]